MSTAIALRADIGCLAHDLGRRASRAGLSGAALPLGGVVAAAHSGYDLLRAEPRRAARPPAGMPFTNRQHRFRERLTPRAQRSAARPESDATPDPPAFSKDQGCCRTLLKEV